MLVCPGNGTNRDCISTVGISIKVAIVAVPAPISSGKDKNASFALATIIDSIDERIQQKLIRSSHSDAIVGRTPTAGKDLRLLEVIIEGFCFLNVSDFAREDSKSSDLGVPSNPYTAKIIPCRGDFSRAARSMVVIPFTRQGNVNVVVEIVRSVSKLFIG